MDKFLAVFVTATILFFTCPARGEETPPPCQTVTECTERGAEAYREGRYTEAAEDLRRANDLESNEVVQLNLAQALEGEGSCTSLLEAQDIYQGLSNTAGAVLENARAGLTRIADPLATCEEEATPPEPTAEPLEEPPPPETTPPASDAPRPRQNRLETAGWVFLGVGLTMALTGGGILWPLAGDAAGERDTLCSRMGCSSQDELEQWVSADERRETFALWGDVLFFSGGAVAIAGLIWALVARYRHRRETSAVVSFLPSGNGDLLVHW